MGTLAIEVAPGGTTSTMPCVAADTQQHDFVHAGILAIALDGASGHASSSCPRMRLSSRSNLNSTCSLRSDATVRFQGQNRETRADNLACGAYAFAISGGKEKLIATMSRTLDIRSWC